LHKIFGKPSAVLLNLKIWWHGKKMIAVVETFILDDPTPTLIIDKYCGKYGIEGNYLLQCCIVKFKPLERIFS
jgi:hypothetical protein